MTTTRMTVLLIRANQTLVVAVGAYLAGMLLRTGEPLPAVLILAMLPVVLLAELRLHRLAGGWS